MMKIIDNNQSEPIKKITLNRLIVMIIAAYCAGALQAIIAHLMAPHSTPGMTIAVGALFGAACGIAFGISFTMMTKDEPAKEESKQLSSPERDKLVVLEAYFKQVDNMLTYKSHHYNIEYSIVLATVQARFDLDKIEYPKLVREIEQEKETNAVL